MNNIEAAKKLYWKYLSITYDDLVNEQTKMQKIYIHYDDIIPNLILRNITGFGSTYSCMLCDVNCSNCIYKIATNESCSSGIYHKTYWAIHEAKDLQQLLSAIKDRAHWLAEVIVMVEGKVWNDTNTD